MNFILTQEQLQKLADYLVTKPWHEANPLMMIVANAKTLPEPTPEKTAPAAEKAAPAAEAPKN